MSSLGRAALLLASVGCTEALKGPTSGQIGCAEREITITEDSHGQYARTWTAECRGQTYYCSAHKSLELEKESGKSGAQVSCTRAIGGDLREASNGSPERSTTTTGPAPINTTGFPEEALGFRLGMTRAQAEDACTSGDHEWRAEKSAFRCVDAPSRIGASTSTRVGFCGGELCLVVMTALFDPEDEGADKVFRQIVGTLQSRYGEPRVLESRIPQHCQKSIAACAAKDEASWRARWVWTGGRYVLGELGAKSGNARLVVRYSTKPPGVSLDSVDEVDSADLDTSGF